MAARWRGNCRAASTSEPAMRGEESDGEEATIGMSVANARVEEGIEQVRHDVGEKEEEGDHQREALDHREVAIDHGVQYRRSHARHGEDVLDRDLDADHVAEL